MSISKKSILLCVLAYIALITSLLSLNTMSKYTSQVNKKFTLNVIAPSYTVTFHSNNGLDEETTQTFKIGETKRLDLNTFTNGGLSFSGWNTSQNGSGTRYGDNELVTDLASNPSEIVHLYAQWSDGVAIANGVSYDSLQKAIDKVTTDGVLTTVILLKNVSEEITTYTGQNIEFDLGNYTISNVPNTTKPTIENAATLHIKNGTITTDGAKTAAINNRNKGVLYITGGRIITTGKRQAVYNDDATITISDNAYLESSGIDRAAFQNTATGTATILGGTIISTANSAVNNLGNLTIGTKNNDPDSNILIRGNTYGVTSTPTYSYYDGIIYGKTKALNDDKKVTDKEEDYFVVHHTESIDGVNYDKVTLDKGYVVTFNPNKGNVSETSRNVVDGDEIGTLPSPYRPEYRFIGWYTEPDGGIKVESDYIVDHTQTLYAHWTVLKTEVAQIGDVKYDALVDAIAAVPNSTPTTVKLLKNVSTFISIKDSKNITLDLNGNKISSFSNDSIIENYGNLTILNGNIGTTGAFTGINQNSGNLTLNGVNITCSGTKQALFVRGGTVIIDNGSYLESSTSGQSKEGANLTRGTIHLLSGGVVNVRNATIVGTQGNAISNEGTITIGLKDGIIDNTSITIIGKIDGVENTSVFNFYDGIIKGENDVIVGSITEIEDNSHIVDGTEVIDGVTYMTKYLELD